MVPRVSHWCRFSRLVVLSIAVVLTITSCGDADDGQAVTTTLSAAPGPELDQPVLVTNVDGVFQIDAGGTVIPRVTGPVAVAVDDTQGGLLYQVESGRSREPGDRSTVVWWIPQGASGPQELLVPAPSSGHVLTLHDTYSTPPGFAVLYTRHETTQPVDEMVDSLRRFDVPNRQVTELYSQGAFEEGFGEVSAGGALISGTRYGQVSSGCFLFDLDGRPTDLVPPAGSDPSGEEQVSGCRLSPDGTQLALVTMHGEGATVSLKHLETGEQTHFEIPENEGTVGTIDVSDRSLLVNLERDGPLPAIVFDLGTPDTSARPLPIAGVARFINGPLDIGDQVSSPSTSTETLAPATGVSLLDNGLGVVSFGEPADSAVSLLIEAVGSQPTGESTITGVMPGGYGGTTARFVEFGQLSVILSDGQYYRDDGVMHFAGWTLSGTGSSELATPEGITLGSTADDLRAAFGERAHLPEQLDECTGAWVFTVGEVVPATSERQVELWGVLDGPPTGSASVTLLSAGAQSTC